MNKHQEVLNRLKKITRFGGTCEVEVFDEDDEDIKILQELVDKHEKIKKALNKVIHERINETGKVLEREEISYIQALQFVLKLLDWSEDEN